jgi:hypothetical protein
MREKWRKMKFGWATIQTSLMGLGWTSAQPCNFFFIIFLVVLSDMFLCFWDYKSAKVILSSPLINLYSISKWVKKKNYWLNAKLSFIKMIILQKESFWIYYWKTSPLNYIDAFKMQENKWKAKRAFA